MKRKTLWVILATEAAVCVLLRVLQASFSGVFSAVMAFPFEQIGMGLRALSLSGAWGNAAAIVLYAAIALVPAAILLPLARHRPLHGEDGLLVLLSATLFAVLYGMVNPGMVATIFGGTEGLPVAKAILGGTVYSVLCGYLVLRVLRLFFGSGTGHLLKYLSAMLIVLNLLFVYGAFGAAFGSLMDSIAKLQAGNTDSGQQLGVSYAFLILQFVVDGLPYVLNVSVAFAAMRLVDELRLDRYSAGAVAAAGKLSQLCGGALAATALASMAFNLLQLLFARSLRVIYGSVQIPLLSFAFMLAVLLLSQFISENKQLKDDNNLFI
jgi:hypothetical protein